MGSKASRGPREAGIPIPRTSPARRRIPLRKTFIKGDRLAAAEERKMRAFLKTILLVAVGVAVLAATLAAPLSEAKSSVGPIPARALTITLYGSMAAPAGWGWTANNITEPGPTLTVLKGDVITFHLFSNDTITHQLIIDLDNNHLNSTGDAYSIPFSSKTTATDFTYTANTVG